MLLIGVLSILVPLIYWGFDKRFPRKNIF